MGTIDADLADKHDLRGTEGYDRSDVPVNCSVHTLLRLNIVFPALRYITIESALAYNHTTSRRGR